MSKSKNILKIIGGLVILFVIGYLIYTGHALGLWKIYYLN